MALYRHEAKTRNRYHLGASFDLGFTRIKKELEAPRPKKRFLVKFCFSDKIHLAIRVDNKDAKGSATHSLGEF